MAATIRLTDRELKRLDIINRLIRKQINGTQASKLLNLSVRQVRRLKVEVSRNGSKAIAHGGRGKASNFKLSGDERKLIASLVKEHYYDFGPTLAAEKLAERHNIHHDPNTVKAIMIAEKLWTPRRKKGKGAAHRAWRLRRANYGELVQFDGSYEHWFEDRNGSGEVCLLAAIDDATGNVVQALFDKHEGVFPIFGFWREYLLNKGKPVSVYLDKFSTYKMSQRVAQENHELKTQFQRALTELRIEPIFANSPQAKGRVEKLFRTLQDRLIKELRLQNISDIETANKFLQKKFVPDFNRRFAVLSRNPANLHQPLSEKEKTRIDSILSKQTTRTIQNDFTVSFNKQWHQILPSQSVTVCKRDKIVVEERLDGTIHFCLRGKYLNTKSIPKFAEQIDRRKPRQWIIAANQTTEPVIDR